MKKKFVKNSLISMAIVLILGFTLIFSSGTIAQKRGDSVIRSNGRSMDCLSTKQP